MRCYLDYNASAPMIKEVKNYIVKILDKIGNPSSIHSSGREVKKILENSRKNVSFVCSVVDWGHLCKHLLSVLLTGRRINARRRCGTGRLSHALDLER